MQKERLVIKGTILTYGEKFTVGEDVFSSLLFSVMNSWYYSNYTNLGELKANNHSELKLREFGRINSALNGYTEDLHNISINLGLLTEIKNNQEIGKFKSDLYFSLLLENLFTNLRSLYDFFYHFIKICLSEKQLKQYPQTDSINKLLSFSLNPNNKEKLPESIIWYLNHINTDLDNIKKIRDSIIHKGKDIVLTRRLNKLLMRIPIKSTYSNDNLLPNILKSEDENYDVYEYLNKIIKTTFSNMEDLGVILFNEIYQNQDFEFNLYSLTNYCIDEFNEFLINKNFC